MYMLEGEDKVCVVHAGLQGYSVNTRLHCLLSTNSSSVVRQPCQLSISNSIQPTHTLYM